VSDADLDVGGPNPRRTRIALVGVGRRARETLVPAIHAVASRIDLVAVCARSERPVELLGGRFHATAIRLADVDLGGLDAVVVAVGTRSVPRVLDELASRGGAGLTLMVDTPVLDPADLAATKGLGRFRAVLASEDNFALPLFALARRLVDEDRVGRLRKVYLFHSGYRHHALAALRRLTGARPRSVSVDRASRWSADVHVSFSGGVRATIVEPRRYEIGRTLVVGEAGFLADYPLDHPRAIHVGYRTDAGRFRGLTVDDEPVPTTALDEAFDAALGDAPLEDDSLMSQMKIRGAMELLVGLGDPTSRERYPAADAIEDNLAMHVAERIRLAPARGPLLRPAARAAASFTRGERS
jgi:predicted dehydrogenase